MLLFAVICGVLAFALIGFWFASSTSRPEHKPEISPVVQQVCDSLENDDGWVFVPATTEKNDTRRASGWYNSTLEIHFCQDPCTDATRTKELPPRIYRPFTHFFTHDELAAINKAISARHFSRLLSKRIDLIGNKNNPEEAELTKKIDQAQTAVRKR